MKAACQLQLWQANDPTLTCCGRCQDKRPAVPYSIELVRGIVYIPAGISSVAVATWMKVASHTENSRCASGPNLESIEHVITFYFTAAFARVLQSDQVVMLRPAMAYVLELCMAILSCVVVGNMTRYFIELLGEPPLPVELLSRVANSVALLVFCVAQRS